jgi:L-threonylcarbamoyladenylate synthase
MKTEIIPINRKGSIEKAFQRLKAGGLAAFPTDTVYGLGALAFDGKAVELIYLVKERSVEKSIPVLIGDMTDLDRVAVNVPEMAVRLADSFWPGPLTLVLPKHPEIPSEVSSTGTIGVRIPDHAGARSLLRAAGPLAVTSANITDRESPTTAEDVFRQLKGRIPLILDGGKTPGGVPSTVVDCTGSEPLLLREGPISFLKIRTILG